ncbi:MAG: hypothetical protein J1E82_05000 [Muribaculaceae bacterium]|nr:hypothetical protein [Muribaculaceae bacterium]
MKKILTPNLQNLINLFNDRLEVFKGESRHSYEKALTSFKIFIIANYPMSHVLDNEVIENWIVDNRLRGLSEKTASFYLDKVASLYSRSAENIEGGKSDIFKSLKKKLKTEDFYPDYSKLIDDNFRLFNFSSSKEKEDYAPFAKLILNAQKQSLEHAPENVRLAWISLAIRCGILPSAVKAIVKNIPDSLNIFDLCTASELDNREKESILSSLALTLKGNFPQWFAMRLRPGVNFETLLDRFSKIKGLAKMPELFYPCDEIAVRIGRKIVWKGRPIIRDVVFFKYKITDIYKLFNYLYDIAWCYRNPGVGSAKYAVIPSKAMEDFRKAIGILGPGYEVAPAGELELKPGDKVVVVNGEFADLQGLVVKSSPRSLENENIVYRVALLDRNGRWEIGVDARLLKKI